MTHMNMNTRSNLFLLLAFSMLLLPLSACEKPDDDDDAGEQEYITKITLRLVEEGSGKVTNITWNDPNGDGVGDFSGTAALTSSRTYKGTIELLNELATNPEERDITKEIEEEADEHQFFYTFSSAMRPYASITITDRDSRGLPVGLKFDLVTSALPGGTTSLTGSLNVVLSHFSTIRKTGSNPGNEEDINITAPVSISNQ